MVCLVGLPGWCLAPLSSRVIEVHRYMYTRLLICGRWSRRSDPSLSAVGSLACGVDITAGVRDRFFGVLAPRIRQESEVVINKGCVEDGAPFVTPLVSAFTEPAADAQRRRHPICPRIHFGQRSKHDT